MNTREKILTISRTLFNELGFGNPTLNLLAQRVGISRGNLTYYFKDKEAILEALVDEMWLEYELMCSRTMQIPSWGSTNKGSKAFHELQKQYAFIFFDMKVIGMPKVAQLIQKMKKSAFKRQMSLITFSVELGNMKAETIPGAYHNLCETLWMILFYWLASSAHGHEQDQITVDKLTWGVILPHFTKKGLQSFIAHFGEDYYQSLGKIYNHDQNQKANF